jgi:hypothetical protein
MMPETMGVTFTGQPDPDRLEGTPQRWLLAEFGPEQTARFSSCPVGTTENGNG